MKRTTSFLVRVALMAVALALAVVFVGREAGSPAAEATTFNPQSAVSVADPTPGAHSDLMVSFSIDAPDAFVNLTDAPTIQFIPKKWGINADAPIGTIGGTFDALATLGILGLTPCTFSITFNPTMYVSSVDPGNPTSGLDLPGSPGGPGYSGQFVPDPDTVVGDSDLGTLLVPFNADEFHNGSGDYNPGSAHNEAIYRDLDGSGAIDPSNGVTAGDLRLTDWRTPGDANYHAAGTTVMAGDEELTGAASLRAFLPMEDPTWPYHDKHDESVAANGMMDVGEGVYDDGDISGNVSIYDIRQFEFEGQPPGSTVSGTFLPGGVNRYPDFLDQMFPSDEIGPPLLRLWGGQNVLVSAISLNIVMFSPGQLPGYPPSLGYPTAIILLDPVAPVDLLMLTITSDLCTPLALVNTNFGIGQDNPNTPDDESGIPLLTNPKEGDQVFTLVTTSIPDADDDGIENWLDTCMFDPNIEDLDGRSSDADNDGLDGACDPLTVYPSDWGTSLVPFNADEFHNGSGSYQPGNTVTEAVYLDVDGSGASDPNHGVTTGDLRLTDWRTPAYADYRPAGTTVGIPAPSDLGAGPLVPFVYLGDYQVGNEFHNGGGTYAPGSNYTEAVYLDNDGSGATSGAGYSNGVTVGDLRLTQFRYPGHADYRAAGTTVVAGDPELVGSASYRRFIKMADNELHLEDVAVNGVMDVGESVYTDNDASSGVSYEDTRQFEFEGANPGSTVGDSDQANVTTRRFVPMAANELHDETVAANGVMDVGEGVYTDNDASGDVSYGDRRQFFFEGANPNSTVQATGASPYDPSGLGVYDEDQDNYANRADVCPLVPNGIGMDVDSVQLLFVGDFVFPFAEYTDLIGPDNQADTDGDRIGDACDPDPLAVTGTVHVVTLERTVTIFGHGVSLNKLNGKTKVKSEGSATYLVQVGNTGSSGPPEEVQVELKVVEGCATVSGPSTISVNHNAVGNATYTVDWSGCPDGEYTVQVDACHAGDPNSPGLFGAGACPGDWDGGTDYNANDDAPRSAIVTVGSP